MPLQYSRQRVPILQLFVFGLFQQQALAVWNTNSNNAQSRAGSGISSGGRQGYWTRDSSALDTMDASEQNFRTKNNTSSKGGSTTASSANKYYTVESISAGEDHTCVVLSHDGGVRCWGSGFYGQLGSGSSENIGDDPTETNEGIPRVNLGTSTRPGDRPIEVAVGAAHTCVLLEDGGVKCWGWGVCGQTGLATAETVGDDPDEMGINLRRVDLGGKKAVFLALGETHSCAILDDGKVRCWGCNTHQQLGLFSPSPHDLEAFPMSFSRNPMQFSHRSTVEVVAGSTFTCARGEDGKVECVGSFGSASVGFASLKRPLAVSLPGPATQLLAGRYFACALVEGGMYCWGQSYSGEFPGTDVVETYDSSPSSSSFQTKKAGVMKIRAVRVKGFGENNNHRIKIADAGDYHVCVSTGNVTHKCWGWNSYQQLGFKAAAAAAVHGKSKLAWGSEGEGQKASAAKDATMPSLHGSDSSSLPRFLPGLRVSSLALGSAHTCAVVGTQMQAVRCVGMGIAGQRGDGKGKYDAEILARGGQFSPSTIRFPISRRMSHPSRAGREGNRAAAQKSASSSSSSLDEVLSQHAAEVGGPVGYNISMNSSSFIEREANESTALLTLPPPYDLAPAAHSGSRFGHFGGGPPPHLNYYPNVSSPVASRSTLDEQLAVCALRLHRQHGVEEAAEAGKAN
mmetsp:Transcript_39144/g.65659  ORF Transcript_39144/g.65659 Transcript_39144/m.65659 type:complete len:682 (+) Transcript_39144:109-2154(+)